MIVWGGTDGILLLESGAMYDPATNTWQTISTTDVPAARSGHTAVWTGDHMIVWGGSLNSGGRYDPAIDAWKATTTTSAPSARTGQTAIWSGSEMIVWGGTDIGGAANTGGRYTP
jgi:N-acetylneuraminic acid mutarotase